MSGKLKSVLLTILVAALLMWVPVQALAAETGTCGEGLSWSLENGTLTVSGTGTMDHYSDENPAPWFEHRSQIQAVVVEDGVTGIGAYAFFDCRSLKTATLADSVKTLGYWAFWGCYALEDVTLSQQLERIGSGAFWFCLALEEINIPAAVSSIGADAFLRCDSLTAIRVHPDNAVYREDKGVLLEKAGTLVCCPGGFEGRYTVPADVTAIGSKAFAWCAGLMEITLPESLVSIGSMAFYGCEGLEEVTVPATVTTVGAQAFSGCGCLLAIHVQEGSAAFSSQDGVLYDRYMTTLLQYPGGLGGEYVAADRVRTVGSWAFSGCEGLTAVTLPDTLRELGVSAFQGCAALEDVHLGSGLTSVGNSAFDGCAALKDLEIPETVTQIGDMAFSESGLEAVVLPAGVRSVGASAFYRCAELSLVVLPKGLRTVGGGAFSGCTGLAHVIYAGTQETWRDIKFGEKNEAILESDVHYGLTMMHQAPTCTAAGMRRYTCGGCGTVLEEQHFEALGHSFGDWVETRPATESLEGEKERTCATCGEVEKQSIPKLEPEKPANPFVDVPEGKYYTVPVLWAVEQGITTGVTANTFEPGTVCNRQQIVMFLWRAAGSPEPETMDNPFTDVTLGSKFIKPILWAVEKGITQGTGNGDTFSPKAECTRQQIVMFLWRSYGQPEPQATESPFVDVSTGSGFFKAIMWAVEMGITKGTGDGSQFSPKDPCTRGQIVTFLHRAMAE